MDGLIGLSESIHSEALSYTEKVSQLQAMTFVRRSWAKISEDVIKNCWMHVGLYDDGASTSSVDTIINELEAEIDLSLQLLNVDGIIAREYLSINDTTPLLTDEQIVELVKPVPLEGDIEAITVPMTAEEKIRSFSGCIEALNEDPVANVDLISALCVLIRSTKAEEHLKLLNLQKQSKITDFLPNLSKCIFTQNSIRYTVYS